MCVEQKKKIKLPLALCLFEEDLEEPFLGKSTEPLEVLKSYVESYFSGERKQLGEDSKASRTDFDRFLGSSNFLSFALELF